MTTPTKIIDIDFASSKIVNNSTELIISSPDSVPNANIYSQSMISMETNTLTRNVAVTLNCLSFNASKKEYIKLQNDLTITSNITVCLWVFIKNEALGLNNAILDFSHKDSTGKFSNILAVKTDQNGNIAFIVNNSFVFLKCNLDQWTHYCWTMKQDKTDQKLADWKITTNGKPETSQSFKKLYLDRGVVLNNNLIGKSESDTSLLHFNGKLGGITIYGGILNNSNLDIYRNDPTIKYLQSMEDELDEIYGKEKFQNGGAGGEGGEEGGGEGRIRDINTFTYVLYDKNTYMMDKDTPTNTTNDILEQTFPPLKKVSFYDNDSNIQMYKPEINYENTGLGILFICITIIIYKYF
jgi:hypothetical protein